MPKASTVVKILGMATAAAAGVLAVKEAKKRLDASPADGRPISSSSRNARSAAMAGLGAKAGSQYALHRARKVFASAEQHAELDAAFELQTAESIAAALGDMKGAMMKLGQMASYLDQGMPEPVREALAELQANAPPMSAELAAQVVADELGAPPEEVFDTWDPKPIAAASIGQVHRAITKDGRAVAVKVQYPGVGDAIRADLDNAGMLFGAMGMMLPGLEPGPLVEELRLRLVEELDYLKEADNQRLFADYYADHPFIHIPAVVDELCAERVLTTELAEGVRFDELETWSQAERDLAAEAIFRFVFGSLYRLHAFNGDPHPGNYLFQPGGQVTFLDFGLVKRFDPEEVELIADMLKAMALDRDIKEYRRLIERIGMLKSGSSFTDEEVMDYFGHFYDFVQRDEVGTITPEYASETVRRFFDYGGEHAEILRAANIPPTFVIIQRINLGLYAIFGQLRATANWRRISEEIWPFVEAPPSTEMGERAAAWAAAKGHRVIEVIALDGDDTLWHSEHLFVDTQDRFRELVRPFVDLDDAGLDERLLDVERRNLPLFGYGVKAFTLSLVETAIEVTDGRIPGADLQAVLDLGKVLIDHPVELLDGVREAVDALTDRYRVMVITKGDLLHQETKVARSGLAELFWRVEIVSEKDEGTYARILERHAIDPSTFVMVGNSVRSDVLPVLSLGGRAVHVPYSVTWALEHAEPDPDLHEFPVLTSVAELPACIESMARET